MALKNFNSESGFSVGVYPTIEVVDRNGKVIANALNVTGLANLGTISNLVVQGGTAGQFIATDGAGNLVFSDVSQLAAAGPDYSVQFNVAQELSGDANLTFDPTTGTLSATAFAGEAASLANITGDNVTGWVKNANFANFAGTTLNALESTTTQTVIGSDQTNITKLGSLRELEVQGAIIAQSTLVVQGDATIFGNLVVQGTAIYSNVQTVNITDPIVEQGGSPFGYPLAANDTINRGTLLHYYTTQPVDAFMGWDSNTSQFMFASNVSYVENEIIVQQYGNLKAQNFIGNGVGLTNIDGANVTGIVATAEYSNTANYSAYAGNVTASAQPNITSLGSLDSLTVLGSSDLGTSATAVYFVGDGGNLSNMIGANVVGEVEYANFATYSTYATSAVTVVGADQPAITSVGELVDLTVTGEIKSLTGANLGDQVIANYFIGNGRSLTNLTGAEVTGVVANATHAEYSNIANTITACAQPNITSVGTLTGLTVSGDMSASTITGLLFVGNGFGLTNINGANVSEVANANFATYAGLASIADFAGNVTVPDQPLITSLGSLVRLDVIGNITSGNADLGNLATAEFFSGNGAFLSALTGANVTGTVANAAHSLLADNATNSVVAVRAGTVTASAQPLITSVGTLTSLLVTGNITSANANLGNLATANFFSGNGSLLTSISNLAIVGTVANANFASYAEQANTANYAGNVTIPDQPLITSLGALTSLTVIGNITSGNANLGNLAIANFFSGSGNNLSNIQGTSVSGEVAFAAEANSVAGANVIGEVKFANLASYAANVTVAAQPSITSLGTLTGLAVSGDITASNILTVNEITAGLFTGSGAGLADINGANVSEVDNANYATYSGLADVATVAGTVTAAEQLNITRVGVLSSLTVAGTIASDNAILGEIAQAEYFVGNGSLLTGVIVGVANTIANGASNVAIFDTTIGLSANNTANVVLVTFDGATVTGNLIVTDTVTAENVTATLVTGTLTTPAQPNITSLGTLTGLAVDGSVTVTSLVGNISGNIAAPGNETEIVYNKAGNTAASTAFTFNDTSNTLSVTGNIAVSNYLTRDSKSVPTFASSPTSPNNPQLGDQWYDTDNDVIYQYIYDGVVSAWVDISSGFINANTQATPDTLAFRTSTGNIAANTFVGNGLYVTDATITGNLVVSGDTAYVNVTALNITDPIIQLGNLEGGAPLTLNDGKDRGEVLHYYSDDTDSAQAAFMGWDSSNSEFAFGSKVTLSENVVTFAELGNIRANYFLGDGSGLTNINAAGAGITGNVVALGMATDSSLTSPGTVTSWETTTTITDAIDDLNEAMENVRNNTYVKSVSFTGTPTAGGAGTTVTLTITSVGNPNRYDITWGDGTQTIAATSTTPTHVYATNVGSPYTVTVRAYNNAGSGTGSEASFSRASYIIIYTANPVVTFGLYRASTGGSALSGSTLYASEGETVYLENTTTNTTGATVTYTINWGDGNTDTISSDSVAGGVGGGRKSHVYATGQNSGTGTKTITLTITSHNTATPSYIAAGPNSTAAIKVYDPAIGAPAGLGTKTITFSSSVGTSPYLASGFANNTGGATTYTAGVAVSRILTGSANSVTLTSYAYDGDSGTLAAYINGVDLGNIELTTADNSGTNGALILNSESDYNLLTSAGLTTTFLLSTYSPGLYKGFKATVSEVVSALNAGVNNLKLSHTTSGNTNIVEFVKDDVTVVPTVDLTNATIANATNGTYRYISGVPYYNTGSPTVSLAGANIYNWIGQTYQNTTTPFQIAAGTNDESTTGNVVAAQTKTYANLDGASTFLTGGIPNANTGNTVAHTYTIGSQSINVAPAGIAAVQTVKFLATNVNGTGAYATHSKKIQVFTATPSGFVEDNISCTIPIGVTPNSNPAKRIVIDGTGATRAFNSATNYYTSGLWSGAQTIAGTDSAVVRWNALKHYATDLTAYLPAGPDLATGRSTTQYFFGAFSRTARSSFTVTITGTIRGLYFAAPGTTIDSTSSLNGWLDASIAYNGAGVPGADTGAGGNGTNGCAVGTNVPMGTAISSQTYTITLGTVSTTNSTGNQILFSIALNAGDTVTSWSFS